MPPQPARRWPIQPLIEAVGLPGCHALATSIAVDEREVARWREAGGFTDLWADRAAVWFGLHPALVWTDWYEAAEPQRADPREVGRRWRQANAEMLRQRRRARYLRQKELMALAVGVEVGE